VDHLVAREVRCVTVLDISGAALARARARLGDAQHRVTWIDADVTGDWAVPRVDVWHDRAVFHFLTDAADRARYLERLRQGLPSGGTAVIATFAPDGPEKCSGLPVARYSAGELAATLGPEFRLVETIPELHATPSGATQSFQYSRFVRER
jgi:trans-aconitate methyltransferase